MRRRAGLCLLVVLAAGGCSTPAPDAPDVSPLVAAGWASYTAGDFDAARAAFAAAIAANPAAAAAHAGQGYALARLGQLEAAAASLDEAVALDPGEPAALAGLALVEATLAADARVIDAATRLLQVAPRFIHPVDPAVNAVTVRLVRARARFNLGLYAGAAEDLDILDPEEAPHSEDPQELLDALARVSGDVLRPAAP